MCLRATTSGKLGFSVCVGSRQCAKRTFLFNGSSLSLSVLYLCSRKMDVFSVQIPLLTSLSAGGSLMEFLRHLMLSTCLWVQIFAKVAGFSCPLLGHSVHHFALICLKPTVVHVAHLLTLSEHRNSSVCFSTAFELGFVRIRSKRQNPPQKTCTSHLLNY